MNESEGTDSTAIDRSSEEKSHILDDYVLMEILNYLDIKDLFRWLRVSQQFSNCIEHELRVRKHLFVAKSDLIFQLSTEFWTYLCHEKQHQLNDSHYLNSNIDSAVSHYYTDLSRKNGYHYLHKCITNLKSITQKCQLIECLALKDCYLNEKFFKFLNKHLKHLKCLSIFQCFLVLDKINKSPNLNNLYENITHLSIFQMTEGRDFISRGVRTVRQLVFHQPENQSLFWTFIKRFKKLEKLSIVIKSRLGIKRLFNTRFPSLDSLTVSLDDPTLNTLSLSDSVFKTDNISHLKSLNIKDYYISNGLFQSIIDDMNLTSLAISVKALDLNLLSSLAEKHKQLAKLIIYWSSFSGSSSYVDTPHKFMNVNYFCLNNSHLTAEHFRRIIRLFPVLKTLKFTPYQLMTCTIAKTRSCSSCLSMCFDMIPRLDSMKTLIVSFTDMSRSVVECLHRFPNLNHLTVTSYWGGTESDATIDRFNLFFRDIIEYLADKCNQMPSKLIRIYVWKYIQLPDQIVIPKNLLIVEHSDILFNDNE